MKIPFVLLIWLCCFAEVRAQETSDSVASIGKVLASGMSIQGEVFVFPERIFRVYADRWKQNVILELRALSKNKKKYRNRGEFMCYDPDTKQKTWSKPMKYNGLPLEYVDSCIYHPGIKESYCYNLYTGELNWRFEGQLLCVGVSNGIGMEHNSMRRSQKIWGLDIQNGEKQWTRKFNVTYGIDYKWQNDSILYFMADGLHQINLKTGWGWDYQANTGGRDYSRENAILFGGLLIGFLTGFFILPTGQGDPVKNLSSDILFEGDYLYWASKERLLCFEAEKGDTIWEAPLPQSSTSKSFLFVKDSLVYMINLGVGNGNFKILDIGNPYVAAFNKYTGKQLFCNVVFNEKERIHDFQILDHNIWLAYVIIDRNGKAVAELYDAPNMLIFYDKLYKISGDQLIITDLNKILF